MVIKEALMETVFYDETPAVEGDECKVRIDENLIDIIYKDGKDDVIYTGKDEEGNGHYNLECRGKRAKATLHKIPNTNILEGYWVEEGDRGFWRIVLE